MTQTPPQRSILEVLRAKIVEAVPSLVPDCRTVVSQNSVSIQLADVLLAMQGKHNIIGVDYNGYFLDCDKDMNNITQSEEKWNLSVPLELQTQDVIDFLTTILV